MAIQVSPGVVVQEFDNTTVVPAVSTSVGAIAGVFSSGPVNQRVLVNSETQLVQIFGKPNTNNFETFFTAANFLAYGNALYVVRVADGSANNAYANVGAITTAPQFANSSVFVAANNVTDNNVAFVARSVGSQSNALRVSICDSANVYSSNLVAVGGASANFVFVSGNNVAVINASSNTTSQANTTANNVINLLTVGDWVKVGNTSLGYQYLQVANVTGPTGAETTANATNYSNGAQVTFTSAYNLSSNLTSSTNQTQRFWEFYNVVPQVPGVSSYMSNQGLTVADQLHIVVQDRTGTFSTAPNSILEVWPNMSRATDAKTPQGSTNYFKNVINQNSSFIYAGSYNRTGAVSNTSTSLIAPTTTTPLSANLANGSDSASESTISLAAVAQGYDQFKNKTDVDISLVMQGKAIGNTTSNTAAGLSNYIISNIAEGRKDCVAFVSPDSAIVTAADPSQYAVDFRNKGITIASSYAVLDGNYKYQYDKYNDVYRWVPLNGDIAGLCAYTDLARDPWWSPAGFNRGQIKNVTKLAFNPNQAQRDLLYQNYVNPVANFQGQGTILYGDKTLLGQPSAFDRINVRRLFIVLEKAIAIASQASLFEFNDDFTRNKFVNLVTPFLRQVQGRRGIYNFRVVCDTTNNTPQVIDANQFVGDIYIQPAKSINFIQLNFVAVRTGVDFNTIVGQFGGS
jgi:phage tail sheath protein FI